MEPTGSAGGRKRVAGVRDAKARLSELLADVRRGKEWLITDRGRPVAKIVPVSQEQKSLEARLRRLEQAGVIESLGDGALPVPPPLPLRRGLARRILEDERGR